MRHETTEQFVRALEQAETSHDSRPLVDLFSDDAELMRPIDHEPWRGQDGADGFWRAYLGMFRDVRSRFTHIAENEDGATLEWESDGELANGHRVHYRGVSILEIDGDRVRRFRTYYDASPFVATG